MPVTQPILRFRVPPDDPAAGCPASAGVALSTPPAQEQAETPPDRHFLRSPLLHEAFLSDPLRDPCTSCRDIAQHVSLGRGGYDSHHHRRPPSGGLTSASAQRDRTVLELGRAATARRGRAGCAR